MKSGAQSLVEIGVLESSPERPRSLRNSLLIVTVRINDWTARALIDSGATHNFVSEQWIGKAHLPTEVTGGILAVTLADGRQLTVREVRTKELACSVSGFQWTDSLTVIPMTHYDLVLGKPWLTDHNPSIDFVTNTIRLGENKESVCQADLTSSPSKHPKGMHVNEAQFLNIQQARKELKRGAECLLVKLDSAKESVGPPGGVDSLNVANDLEQGKQEDLRRLLFSHARCFPKTLPMKLPPKRKVNHDIKVEEGAKPPSRPPFRMSSPELDELQRQLQELLNHGFIEPSNSPYGAPVFFIKKADGSLRMVCDWRPLNKITVKVQACLPNIEDLFDSVRGAKYFSKLDLKSGYHQVRVREEDVPKTAINTPFGQYQFHVMGFGLTNAPATFMSLMHEVMRPFLRKCVIVFLDDILVFSSTWQEHLQHLDGILRALEEADLFCNASKCHFAVNQIKFLGHIVTGETIAPDPDKLATVTKWPVPKSVKEVRQFLGFTNYFRRFIKDYSSMSRPLEKLTGKYAKFLWCGACQEAFERLRNAMLEAPVLELANLNKKFRVVSDASDLAIGAVLLQADDKGEWHPVAYTSRRLRPEESNYHAMERETLAAIHALRTWKHYLFKPFELVTDNRGVSYLKSKSGLSKREARWVEFLADFDVDIIHCSGKENIADALSRLESAVPDADDLKSTETGGKGELIGIMVSIQADPDFKKRLARGYRTDKKMRHIIKRLKENPSWARPYRWDAALRKLFLVAEDQERLCIPRGKLRFDVLRMCHDSPSSGHPGRDRTYSRISREFYWPRLGRDVARYVKSCQVCQHNKGDRPRESPLQPLPVPGKPWEDIAMDFVTGLPESTSRNNAVLTFVDRLTKQAHFVPTRSTVDAEGTADLYIQNVFRCHGLSRSIVSDRDPRFTSAVYKSIFKQLGVDLKFSTSNHPQTDGQTERVHRTIGQILRTTVNHRQSDWEELLPVCEFAYNDLVQASTCETPFFLNHGHHPVTVPDLVLPQHSTIAGGDWLRKQQEAVKSVKDSIQGALDDQMFYSDKQRKDSTTIFKTGDKVLIHRDFLSTPASRVQPCAKLSPRWFGPFEVAEVLSPTTVRVSLPSFCRAHPVFNVVALKHYCEDNSFGRRQNPPAPIVDVDGHERYVVESVLSQRTFRGKLQYLVKWLGYDKPTWEPEHFLNDGSGRKIVPLQRFLDAAKRKRGIV